MRSITPRLHTWVRHFTCTAAAVLFITLFITSSASAQPVPPDGWLDANINGATGAWSYGDDGFTVSGSGTDIWGTADSFHFVYQQLNGDGDLLARVLSVNGPHDWSKAGLMIRQTLDPGSPHHFLLASKYKGFAYQRRLTPGGTSQSTFVAGTTPLWLRLRRAGTLVELATSGDGVNWNRVATVSWPTGPTYVGFAVTSHDNSTTPTAVGQFDWVALTGNQRSAPFVSVTEPAAGDTVPAGQPLIIRWQANSTDGDALEYFDVYHGVEQGGTITYEAVAGCLRLYGDARSCNWTSPGPATDAAHILVRATDHLGDQGVNDSGRFTIQGQAQGGLPSGWRDIDVGAVGATGSASGDGSNFTVTGSGADIWGTSDEFHYAYRIMSGDFSITARVASVQNVNQWTKAGLMIRDGVSPTDRHASFFATPTTTKGTVLQYREEEGNTSGNIYGPAFTAPVWLKLVKRGGTITSYYRHAITDPWTRLQYQVFPDFNDTVEAGLAVSSHVDGQLATAQFTDVVVESLPPWQFASFASTGNGSDDGTIFGVFGKGADIWGTADAGAGFFVPWVGDGTMTARVRTLENSNAWAKAGVMFRESLATNSKHVFALVSPGHGAALQYRATTGGQSASAGTTGGVAPVWLRMTRTGDTFAAAISADGRTWASIGSVTVPMGQAVYVGIANTTHSTGDTGGAVFDDLRITR